MPQAPAAAMMRMINPTAADPCFNASGSTLHSSRALVSAESAWHHVCSRAALRPCQCGLHDLCRLSLSTQTPDSCGHVASLLQHAHSAGQHVAFCGVKQSECEQGQAHMNARPPTIMVIVMCHLRSCVRLEFQATKIMLAAAGANKHEDSAASRTTCCFPSTCVLRVSCSSSADDGSDARSPKYNVCDSRSLSTLPSTALCCCAQRDQHACLVHPSTHQLRSSRS